MKLGICYMVFDGEEFLSSVVRNVRSQVDFVAVTWQTTSYFGNTYPSALPTIINQLESEGLIDKSIYYEPDLINLTPKENELKLRNIGLEASRQVGCTHHISADVDEFYVPEQLIRAKETFGENDCSLIHMINYYKRPDYLITPDQDHWTSFIHPVTTEYVITHNFPGVIEVTRRQTPCDKVRIYQPEEIVVHHMSYVRKDIRKKLKNNSNGLYCNIEKIAHKHDTYQLGERVAVPPDLLNRSTIRVKNLFGIDITGDK